MFTCCTGGSNVEEARRCMTDKGNGSLPMQCLLIGNVRSRLARQSRNDATINVDVQQKQTTNHSVWASIHGLTLSTMEVTQVMDIMLARK